jgi:2-methylisocitrate lyase-like PEP mutase family enzyme
MASQKQKAEIFKALHHAPTGFLMPNAWDPGSAVVLAQEGFPALGTTSAGIAFSLGKCDFQLPDPSLGLTRGVMFQCIRRIVEAVPLPVNGDLENGYGHRPETVAETVRLAIEAGLAGGNIEDHDPRLPDGLYDENLAAERIWAAREAIEHSGTTFVLNAKIDAYSLSLPDPLKISLRRARLFRDAGADCIYPCGVSDMESVRILVQEAGAPVNVVVGWGGARFNIDALLEAGVTRISVGGSLARAALGFVRAAAREMRDQGTMDFATEQIGQGELNEMFARAQDANTGDGRRETADGRREIGSFGNRKGVPGG